MIISTGILEVSSGGQLRAETRGQADAGSVFINARDRVSFAGSSPDGKLSNAFSGVGVGGIGDGGDVIISTGILEVYDGARLRAETNGQGDAGNVIIDARDSVVFRGTGADSQFASAAFSNVETGAIGNGGDVRIFTGRLEVSDGAQLQAQTEGTGNAGNVIIKADRVSFSGISTVGRRFRSAAFSNVEQTGRGQGGNVDITTGTLSVTNGALLSANLFGQGAAGNVIIKASDFVIFRGTGADSRFGSTAASNVEGDKAIGNGGDVRISTGRLEVSGGAQLQAQTEGTGNAGNVIIDARDFVIFRGTSADGRFLSTAFSSVLGTGAKGDGGDVRISTGILEVSNGARLRADTEGQGDAGNIVITARDHVFFRGISTDGRFRSGAYVTVGRNSGGQGGNLDITTGSLSITNGAILSASSSGSGDGGNIDITARSVRLDRGFITTATNSSDGGNITFNVRGVLSLRRGSFISTEAGTAQAGGNGGNIRIDTSFLVTAPLENNDILANAFNGNGGNVTINAQGIYWFTLRSRDDLVRLLGTTDPVQLNPRRLPTNDISAISRNNPSLNGIVTLNTPDVDPNRGLVPLPVTLIDPSQQIDRRCQPGSAQSRGSFVLTGRGGVASSPTDPLQSEEGLAEWILVEEGKTEEERQKREEGRETSRSASPAEITEATHWIQEADGTIVLVAHSPTATPIYAWWNVGCQADESKP
ncbi:MAG: S-layer family protein [Leptolyngbyaceae cyanobacterium RU_5_1]|nr:S-layer family protein [Leptolyngbyaceae cyanobacterium RU_5_1]